MKKWNYYNEIDPKAAAWIRELIKRKLIPDGEVDERSITEVKPDDVRDFIQAHWFAGICGWPLAFQLAGIPATTPLWTGSCPCQPFSTAGKGLAQADERHLWPVFFDLVRQCRPPVVFGEQVASAIGKGWLDGISADLEAEGYACGAAVLGAHSVGAPHIRQRLYWVANAESIGSGQGESHTRRSIEGSDEKQRPLSIRGGANGGWMADSEQPGLEGQSRHGDNWSQSRRLNQDTAGSTSQSGAASGMVLSNSHGCSQGSDATTPAGHRNTIEPAGSWIDGMGHASSVRQRGGSKDGSRESSEMSWTGHQTPWNDSRLVHCRDGKTRRVPTEPAFFPLAHGVPARVVRLRGYGNAIVPQVAAEFIRAFYETQEDEDFC